MTAFVRRLNRFPAAKYKNVKIIEGDVTDEEKVKFALKDQDFVVSCLGKGLNLCEWILLRLNKSHGNSCSW